MLSKEWFSIITTTMCSISGTRSVPAARPGSGSEPGWRKAEARCGGQRTRRFGCLPAGPRHRCPTSRGTTAGHPGGRGTEELPTPEGWSTVVEIFEPSRCCHALPGWSQKGPGGTVLHPLLGSPKGPGPPPDPTRSRCSLSRHAVEAPCARTATTRPCFVTRRGSESRPGLPRSQANRAGGRHHDVDGVDVHAVSGDRRRRRPEIPAHRHDAVELRADMDGPTHGTADLRGREPVRSQRCRLSLQSLHRYHGRQTGHARRRAPRSPCMWTCKPGHYTWGCHLDGEGARPIGGRDRAQTPRHDGCRSDHQHPGAAGCSWWAR